MQAGPVHDRLAALARRAWALAEPVAPDDGLPPDMGLVGLDMLERLDAACQLAAPDAAPLTLWLEVLVKPGDGDGAELPVLPHLLSVADRDGWSVQVQDRTPQLLALRERVMAACRLHRRALAREGHDVPAGLSLLQRRQRSLQAGHHQGLHLVLTQDRRPSQRVVSVTPSRSEPMRTLFAQAFGHEMSAAHWQWKYAKGHGQAVALVEDGQLVAHYGGLTRELRVLGRPQLGCQVCDVMVAPQARRSLARRGPLYRVAATFLETQIGWGLPHAVGFGFPSSRHHEAADRMKLYAAVDRMVQLAWPAQVSAAAKALPVRTVGSFEGAPGRRWRRTADRLWQGMSAAMVDVVLGVRDSRWLQWRFIERPGVQYQVLLVCSRWLRRPLGMMVLRPREDALELMDWVGRPRHWGTLLAVARDRAASAGLPVLRCWVTASQQSRLAGLAAEPAQVQDLSIDVPACSHTPGPDPATFHNRWYLMSGDADFT
jgi:hypothetical protein